MKKSYLMIAAAAALFVACQDTDTLKEVVNEEVAIGFSSEFASKTTKSEINDTWMKTAGDKFGVYGYKDETSTNHRIVTLFSNEKVTYSNNDWVHTNVRYWDKSADDAYDFYAYAPYSSSAVSFVKDATAPAKTGFTYNLGTQVFADATLDATVDLCVAAVEGTDYNECFLPNTTTASDGHVSFTFDHVLSKLSFNVKKADDLNATVTLNALKMQFPTASTVSWTQRSKSKTRGNKDSQQGEVEYVGDVTYNSDYADPTADTYGVTIVSGKTQTVTTSSTAIADAHSYIVAPNVVATPTEKHKINVKVEYTIAYSDNIVETQVATGIAEINFIENYHYTLTITIDPAKIEFDVDAVNGWSEQHNENVDVD